MSADVCVKSTCSKLWRSDLTKLTYSQHMDLCTVRDVYNKVHTILNVTYMFSFPSFFNWECSLPKSETKESSNK